MVILTAMKLVPILVRFLLLTGAVAVAGVVYINRDKLPLSSLPVADLADKVRGVSSDLGINTDALADQAQKKLVDRQPIIEDGEDESTPGEVKGAATDLAEQTKTIISDAANKAIQSVADIPKDQAAKITRQVCEQIITQLENGQ